MSRIGSGNALKLAVVALVAGLFEPTVAWADWKPDRTVEIVVPSAAGGGFDRTGRTIQRLLQAGKLIPTPSIVVNKPGGGGAVAWTYLNQNEGTGSHLAVTVPSLITSGLTELNSIQHTDVTPIVQLFGDTAAFIVKTTSPLQSGRDLVAALKQKPAGLSIGVAPALGSGNHLALALSMKAAEVDIRSLKTVVFNASSETVTAVAGGHVDVGVVAPNNALAMLKSGRIRVLAVSAPNRLTGAFSAAPTWREQGIDAVFSNWRGIAGPKGMAPSRSSTGKASLLGLLRRRSGRRILKQTAGMKSSWEAPMPAPSSTTRPCV
jgi:putative tricarboxylic transport membrane protein